MRVFIIVHGFVQGVGYRSLVKREADRYKVHGMVSNARDGSVHIFADADEKVLELFRDSINVDVANGPQVRNMEVFPEGSSGFPTAPAKFDDRFIIGRE